MSLPEFSLHLIILSLAVWRASSLLATEDGPLDIFLRARLWFGQRFDEASKPYYPSWEDAARDLGLSEAQAARPLEYSLARVAYVKWDIGRGWCCVWCNSVWGGFLAASFYLAFPYAAVSLALPLALSATALLVERLER